MTIEERLDIRHSNYLNERSNDPEDEIKITFNGIDKGKRYPIAFGSIKPNNTVAFAAYPKTSYWEPITAESNYVNWIKGANVLDWEAEMTSQGRLLDFPQHHEILQNVYNSDKVLRSSMPCLL